VTTQQANELTASLFRQLYLMQMLMQENRHFLKTPAPSRLKNAMHRGANTYQNVVNEVRACLPLSGESVLNELKGGEEKILALNAIFERLSALDEEQLLKFEEEIKSLITIKY